MGWPALQPPRTSSDLVNERRCQRPSAKGRELGMSQRQKTPTSREIAATLREYMRTFTGSAVKTLQLHRCKPCGDCAGCSTATRFVRYPCQIVTVARDVVHPSWSRGQ